MRGQRGSHRGGVTHVDRPRKRGTNGMSVNPETRIALESASPTARGSGPVVQKLEQVLGEGLRVKDVADVLLSGQHQQPRVG